MFLTAKIGKFFEDCKKLFQPQLLIILKPILNGLLESQLELITGRCEFLVRGSD